jgi:hypothetical protein
VGTNTPLANPSGKITRYTAASTGQRAIGNDQK